MNPKNCLLAEGLAPSRYVKRASQNLLTEQNSISSLFSERSLPKEGWPESRIEMFLHELATMDSNNQVPRIGIGEREGRIASSIVSRRSYRMSHGIGRSGDLNGAQPKAVGSTLMYQICVFLARDALRVAGFNKRKSAKNVQVLPMATGMSVGLVLSSLRHVRPFAERVIMMRMDQKSCLKAIVTYGFIPVIVPNILTEEYNVGTDIQALERCINMDGGVETVVAVVTTASCFAPREPDTLDTVAQLCKDMGVPHVINNAYGVQCSATVKLINRACTIGRVDAIVQSTDKNFMVPVGGSVVCGPDEETISCIAASYAGRASSSQVFDLMVTLLSFGEKGYADLLACREELVPNFKNSLRNLAEANGEMLIESLRNNISFAITLESFDPEDALEIGSMLFTRGVTGVRVVVPNTNKTVAGIDFCGYGSSVDNYPCAYITAACAIGLSSTEAITFIHQLNTVFTALKHRWASRTLASSLSSLGSQASQLCNNTEDASQYVPPVIP